MTEFQVDLRSDCEEVLIENCLKLNLHEIKNESELRMMKENLHTTKYPLHSQLFHHLFIKTKLKLMYDYKNVDNILYNGNEKLTPIYT